MIPVLFLGIWLLFLGTANEVSHFPQPFVFPGFPVALKSFSLPHDTPEHPAFERSGLGSAPQPVSIATLLRSGKRYHRQRIVVRGIITQPELHLDESELFFDFVFRLSDEEESIIVFGQHDRTLGPPVIVTDRSVEVIGVFWKRRDLKGSSLTNILEALTVSPYPPSIPDST